MENLYARTVFFVRDGEAALKFYTERLGFTEDWNYRDEGRTEVCQVSLFGFEVILNQIHSRTPQAGQGRIFIGLEDVQVPPVREHFAARGVTLEQLSWGKPTLAIRDPDGNELFFWPDWTRE